MWLPSGAINTGCPGRRAPTARTWTNEEHPLVDVLHRPAERVRLCRPRDTVGSAHTLRCNSQDYCSYPAVPRRHEGLACVRTTVSTQNGLTSRRGIDVCYDRGAPLFFSNTTPQFGSLRPLPKTDWEKNKTAVGWKIPWPRHTTRYMQTKWDIPDDFGLRSPVVQKTFRTKSATYIVE